MPILGKKGKKKENRKKGESSSPFPSICDPHPTVATGGGHGGQRLPSLFLHFGLFAVLGRLESDADGALSECICTLALALAFAIQLFPLALGLQRRSRRAAGPGTGLAGRRRGHHPLGPGPSPFVSSTSTCPTSCQGRRHRASMRRCPGRERLLPAFSGRGLGRGRRSSAGFGGGRGPPRGGFGSRGPAGRRRGRPIDSTDGSRRGLLQEGCTDGNRGTAPDMRLAGNLLHHFACPSLQIDICCLCTSHERFRLRGSAAAKTGWAGEKGKVYKNSIPKDPPARAVDRDP